MARCLAVFCFVALASAAFLRVQEPAAPAPATPGRYDMEAFKEEWHAEWRNGNYPGYKHTNPEAKPFEDSQSDGKPGSLLRAPSESPRRRRRLPRRRRARRRASATTW